MSFLVFLTLHFNSVLIPGIAEPKTKSEAPLSTSRREKRDHAYAYIKRIVDSELVDRSAYAGQDKTLILPYRRLRFFYGEYDFYCRTNHIPLRALENTFRRAFRELKEVYAKKIIPIKFSECRGIFMRYALYVHL